MSRHALLQFGEIRVFLEGVAVPPAVAIGFEAAGRGEVTVERNSLHLTFQLSESRSVDVVVCDRFQHPQGIRCPKRSLGEYGDPLLL